MAINKNIPVTSREKYLAKIAGEEVSASNPINREDYFLNEIAENEGGGGSGGGSEPLVVTGSYDELTHTITLNKTWNEIRSAFPNVYIAMSDDNYASIGGLFVHTGDADSGYYVTMIGSEMGGSLYANLFKAESENGYPSFTDII